MSDYARALTDLVAVLEANGLTYALGGATALAVWSVPRATLDIDINLWCKPEEIPDLFCRLATLGIEVPSTAAKQALDEGVAYLRWRGLRLDVFVPSIPFYEEALRTRVHIPLGDLGMTWVLSAEALCVFKMLFFRPKDVVDVEKMSQILGEKLDRSYVRHHLVSIVGKEDLRIETWDGFALRARNSADP